MHLIIERAIPYGLNTICLKVGQAHQTVDDAPGFKGAWSQESVSINEGIEISDDEEDSGKKKAVAALPMHHHSPEGAEGGASTSAPVQTIGEDSSDDDIQFVKTVVDLTKDMEEPKEAESGQKRLGSTLEEENQRVSKATRRE